MPAVFLPTLSLGYLAASRLANAQNGRLRIHSAFRQTLNVQPDDGALLPLISAHSSCNHPDALRLAVPDRWDWRHCADVWLENGRLVADTWHTALSGVAIWQPIAASTPQITAQGLRFLEEQLRQWCQQNSVDSVLRLLPDDNFGIAVAISPQDSREQLAAMANRIIGFGGGLTPDGDDYLLGYFAGLSLSRCPSLALHRQRLAEVVVPRLTRTNDISRHYLGRAAGGHFSEALTLLGAQLCAPFDPLALANCATGVMAFGAASGADCMAGFLHGLRHLLAA